MHQNCSLSRSNNVDIDDSNDDEEYNMEDGVSNNEDAEDDVSPTI